MVNIILQKIISFYLLMILIYTNISISDKSSNNLNY